MDTYYSMTPMEFECFMEGFGKRNRKEWELARFQAYFSLKPHLVDQYSRKAMDKVIPLPWEVAAKQVVEKMDIREVQDLSRKWGF